MKLEQQVTNKEISQRFQELGVKQESYFRWCVRVPRGTTPDEQRLDDINYIIADDEKVGSNKMYVPEYSAFTVAELGEILPARTLSWKRHTKDFCCEVDEVTDLGEKKANHAEFELTEADARGKMLIYLLENGLITL